MSTTTIYFNLVIAGTLTDATTCKLSDATAAYGVIRTDTSAVVVADNVSMTRIGTGMYSYTFTDPAVGLTYDYVVEYVVGGNTYREEHFLAASHAAVTTRKDLRQRIGGAGFCGDYFSSTDSATGGAAGATLVDTKRTEEDDSFSGAQVVILTGASAGDRRTVATWVQSTGTLTPNTAFTAQIAAGVQYEIHRTFSADDKDSALNEAILYAALRWHKEVEDTSLTTLANTYTYSLDSLTVPTDPDRGLEKVEYSSGDSATGAPYIELSDDYYEIRNSAGALTLQLQYLPPSGRTIRLTYDVRPATLSTDAGTLSVDTVPLQNFICAKATALLFDSAARNAQMGQQEFWQVEAAKMHQVAEGYFGADRPPREPGRVKLWTYGDTDDDFSRRHVVERGAAEL